MKQNDVHKLNKKRLSLGLFGVILLMIAYAVGCSIHITKADLTGDFEITEDFENWNVNQWYKGSYAGVVTGAQLTGYYGLNCSRASVFDEAFILHNFSAQSSLYCRFNAKIHAWDTDPQWYNGQIAEMKRDSQNYVLIEFRNYVKASPYNDTVLSLYSAINGVSQTENVVNETPLPLGSWFNFYFGLHDSTAYVYVYYSGAWVLQSSIPANVTMTSVYVGSIAGVVGEDVIYFDDGYFINAFYPTVTDWTPYTHFMIGVAGVVLMIFSPSWVAWKFKSNSPMEDKIERAFYGLFLFIIGYGCLWAWLGGFM